MIETGSLTKRYSCRALDGLSSTVQPGAVTGFLGLGFGAVILHTAGAIGALTAVAFVLPLIVVDPPESGRHAARRFPREAVAAQ